MKMRIIFVLTAAMLFFSQVIFSSCGDEEEGEPVQNNSGKNNSTNNNGTNNNGTNNNQQTVKEESQYTVSYSSDFGVAPQSLTVKEGDKLTSGDLKPLDTDGYIFLGWYNGSNQVEEGFVVKQDLKLVAKWTKDGVVYANELKEFLAKKTDDSKVYDINISDLNPDMDVVVKALKDNPKIKVNLNLENCTELKDVKIMPDGGISKSKAESFLINLVSLTLPNGVVNIVLDCDGLTSINIPNSVTTIEIYTETPPAIRNANAINPDCKIFVEKECVDAFKNADGWKTVAIQIKTIGGNYLYANELNDFMAKQTDESKVYDVIILDLKPDMDVIVNALIDNPKVKINLDLEGCTDLTEVNIVKYEEGFSEQSGGAETGTGEGGSTSGSGGSSGGDIYTGGRGNDEEAFTNQSGGAGTGTGEGGSTSGSGVSSGGDIYTGGRGNDNVVIAGPGQSGGGGSGREWNSDRRNDSFLPNLITLTLPNGVTNIVLACDGLTSLNIPNSVKEIYIYMENPPVIRNTNTINVNCTIYVPTSAVEIYKNADGWSKYAEQITTEQMNADTEITGTTGSGSEGDFNEDDGETRKQDDTYGGGSTFDF